MHVHNSRIDIGSSVVKKEKGGPGAETSKCATCTVVLREDERLISTICNIQHVIIIQCDVCWRSYYGLIGA